jgi:hypothetical protein
VRKCEKNPPKTIFFFGFMVFWTMAKFELKKGYLSKKGWEPLFYGDRHTDANTID